MLPGPWQNDWLDFVTVLCNLFFTSNMALFVITIVISCSKLPLNYVTKWNSFCSIDLHYLRLFCFFGIINSNPKHHFNVSITCYFFSEQDEEDTHVLFNYHLWVKDRLDYFQSITSWSWRPSLHQFMQIRTFANHISTFANHTQETRTPHSLSMSDIDFKT